MKAIRLLIAAAILLGSNGCFFSMPTLRGERARGKGLHINALKEMVLREGSYASSIGWKEQTYQLDNGNWVYVEPYAPNCFIHWEVNPEDIIVDSRAEGKGCDMWPFR